MISLATLRIVASTLNGFVQFSTCLRLELRRRKKLLWFDDAVAAFATICSFMALVCFWLTTETDDSGPMVESQVSRFRAYWVFSTTAILVVWLSRLSVILSCIRFMPTETGIAPYGYILSAFITVLGMTLFVLKIYFCSQDDDWRLLEVPVCPDNHVQRPLNIIFESLADALLMITPILALFRVKRNLQYRQLLYPFVGVGFFLMASSIIHLAYYIQSDDVLKNLTGSIQIALFLWATNVPTVLGYIAYVYSQQSHEQSGPKDVEDLRDKIGYPKVLRPISIPPPFFPNDSVQSDIIYQTQAKEQFRESVTDSASEYSMRSPVSTPEPAAARTPGKGVRFLGPLPTNRETAAMSSYSSIFAHYITDEDSTTRPPSELAQAPRLQRPVSSSATPIEPVPF